MKIYGLIGYPLSHSFSPEYFNEKFSKENIYAEYKAFPLSEISEIKSLIKNNPNLHGFNVTVPYKEEIIDYLDDIDSEAAEIHSVNTVEVIKNNDSSTLKGYNTDIIGFEQSISPILQQRKYNQALILGTGGTSKTVRYVLNKYNLKIYQTTRGKSRKEANLLNYKDINNNIIAQTKIIINTTPLGMYPDTNKLPDIPYDQIGSEHFLYDVIYNPAQTLFLREGRNRGATTKNGYEMLVLQAEESWKIWNK